MMRLLRRRRAPGVLVVVSDDGRHLRRELAAEWLEDFARAVVEEGDEPLQRLWERFGRLGSEALLRAWPPSLSPPERATLAAAVPRARLGPVLEVGLRAGANLRLYADELERVLGGATLAPRLEPTAAEDAPDGDDGADVAAAPIEHDRPLPPEVVGEAKPHTAAPPAPCDADRPVDVERPSVAPPEPEEEPRPSSAPASLPTRDDAPRSAAAAPPEPAPQANPVPPGPVEEPPMGRPESGQEAFSAPPPVHADADAEEPLRHPRPEVLAPDEHLARRSTGRRWRLGPDDVFGLVGAVHPEDLLDDGLEVREEDVPWLNPGDRIHSPRRGSCRILAVDEGRRIVLVRDENGQELRIQFRELFTEFEFDDEPLDEET